MLIVDCGTLPSISDGSVRLDSTTTTFGSTATVSCNVGYDPSVATIRCQASGAWDLAACTIKDCGTLPSISDGSVRLDSTTTTFGSTATVSCNVGYDPSVATIRCQASGAWEYAACTIKDCGLPPSVSHGSVVLDSLTTTVGSTATVSCATGYVVSPKNTITCQVSGGWETSTCKGCPAGWTLFGVSCYIYSDNLPVVSTNWNDAQDECIKVGGDLVEITSDVEQGSINILLSDDEDRTGTWIGLNDMSVEGKYIWVLSGNTVSFTNWQSGEPNNVSNEDCIIVNSENYWVDIPCGWNRKYICEQSAIANV
ncbi:brevican core protein-like [Mercenaria mercenaria]|uniref:brevican core protein-like n=1 Tax=Mercenaria mercenaria TaxID=6596 RepID=UPI00234F1E54|nr:brevican core protein-like [Mercenaria mercenaria]